MGLHVKCLTVSLVLMMAGCSVSPPKNQSNLCSIFRQYDDWYEDALEMNKEWGTPIPVAMAIVKQESAFVHDAAPPRRYALGFIPRGRISSAYGYSQALDAAWSDYKKATGNGGTRTDFNDAMHFIGWYTSQSHRELGIRKSDTYSQYLAYHEGRTGFKRGVYKNKPKVMQIARKVEKQAASYTAQLRQCRAELEDNRGWWPF